MKLLVRYSGIITVLFVWITLGAGIAKVSPTNLTAISDLGTYEETRVLFSVAFLVSAFTTLVFFACYLDERYKLNKYYKLSYIIAFASQLLVVLIPADPAHNLMYITHWVFALALGFATGGIMYYFALSLNNSVPMTMKGWFVATGVISTFVVSIFSQLLFHTVFIPQSVGMLYTHYWIVRATLLEKRTQGAKVRTKITRAGLKN